MPKAQVEVIDGMGHLPMIERPKEVAEIYLRFLNTIGH
jgi:pimeloyl-ACP methyl ester carboxylesterase